MTLVATSDVNGVMVRSDKVVGPIHQLIHINGGSMRYIVKVRKDNGAVVTVDLEANSPEEAKVAAERSTNGIARSCWIHTSTEESK